MSIGNSTLICENILKSRLKYVCHEVIWHSKSHHELLITVFLSLGFSYKTLKKMNQFLVE